MLHDAVWESEEDFNNRIKDLVSEETPREIWLTAYPRKIDTGIYLCEGISEFNANLILASEVRDIYREIYDSETEYEFNEIIKLVESRPISYGVCDDFEQAIEYCKLRERPEKYFIAFTEVRKDQQSSSGGWRWHKWGKYIGVYEPQYEYLYDEPDIEKVYVFEVFELKE